MSLFTITTPKGATYNRRAWTGGDSPSHAERRSNSEFKQLRTAFYREQVAECGGLGLWACAGTSVLERARIFWNRANGDAWRTLDAHNRRQRGEMWT